MPFRGLVPAALNRGHILNDRMFGLVNAVGGDDDD